MAGTHEGRVLVFPQLTEALTPLAVNPRVAKPLMPTAAT